MSKKKQRRIVAREMNASKLRKTAEKASPQDLLKLEKRHKYEVFKGSFLYFKVYMRSRYW